MTYSKQLLSPVKSLYFEGAQSQLELGDPYEGNALAQPAAIPTLFRPIHYLGSKLRLIGPIQSALDDLDPKKGPVCDLFAGSGTVSLALSVERRVIAVDIQEYSRVLCSAVLTSHGLDPDFLDDVITSAGAEKHRRSLLWAVEPLISHEAECIKNAKDNLPDSLCDLLEQGCLIAVERGISDSAPKGLHEKIEKTLARLEEAKLLGAGSAMVTRYFGGIYFSYRQAAEIDALLDSIYSLPITQRDLPLAALLSTASDVVNTVGKQFAQPIRPRGKDGTPKRHLIKKIEKDRSVDVRQIYGTWLRRYQAVRPASQSNCAVRGDYIEVLRQLDSDVRVVYADPPYTRDHYSRFYHVLETMCLRDHPAISSVLTRGRIMPSRGIYREDRHQSPFCIKSLAPDAFEALFREVRERGIPLLLSYSPFAAGSGARPRLLSIDDIRAIALRSFRHVNVVPAGSMAHSKLNTSSLNFEVTSEAEVLFSCKP